MAGAIPKRILNDKAGKELFAELSEKENAESSEDEVDNFDEEEASSDWRDIGNGVEVYVPSLHDKSTRITTVPWSNESRAHPSFTDVVEMPDPSLFVTDIFKVCKSTSFDDFVLKASDDDDKYKVTIRIRKPAHFIMDQKYIFLAHVKSGIQWTRYPVKLKNGKFWFRAERLSSFFIYATSLDEDFLVVPSGTTFSPRFNNKIELSFGRDTVQKGEAMSLKVWPTGEEQLSAVNQRGDEQCITAMTDTLILEYKAPKLHQAIMVTLPMYGNTEVKSGENLYFFSRKPDSSDLAFEKLQHGEYSILDGKVRVTKRLRKGRSNGVVKTKAKSARTHEILELSRLGYLCQFLYFKLTGGTETHFELWVECARKNEVSAVRERNIKQNMVEFPASFSDDIPIFDQEHMTLYITGAVRLRGSKRVVKAVPIFMKFLAVSETTHARAALVKDQKIDGAYFADIEISFVRPRGRKPIRSQLDPWGRIMQPKENRSKADNRRLAASLENDCFHQKSLLALALSIPPEKVEMLGVMLDVNNIVIKRLRSENDKNIAKFAFDMLQHWKDTSDSSDRCELLVQALEDLDLKNLSCVVKAKCTKNERMCASDFKM